eukprot:1620648-Amphidinium_carterae.1
MALGQLAKQRLVRMEGNCAPAKPQVIISWGISNGLKWGFQGKIGPSKRINKHTNTRIHAHAHTHTHTHTVVA